MGSSVGLDHNAALQTLAAGILELQVGGVTSGGVRGGILELQVTLKLASFVKTAKDFLEKFEENSFHHRRYTRILAVLR